MMQILKREISLISMQLELKRIVTSLQIKKTQNTFIVCIRSQHVQKDETLCYNKKKTHTQSLLRLLGGLPAMNGLENNIISKHLYHN